MLPDLYISRSGFRVTPVLAWWRQPGPVGPGDPAEVTAVARIPVADLADPAHRLMHPATRPAQAGPAFRVGGMLVWGFTAHGASTGCSRWAAGSVPWDASRSRRLPPSALTAPGGPARS